jgi:general secretion pathway protein G
MSRSRQTRRARRAAFTLLEVLLVLIILVIIGGIVAVNYFGVQQGAQRNAAETQMNIFKNALKMYQLQVGSLPSGMSALRERPGDLADPSRWSGPYLDQEIPKDPWGNEYQYKMSGATFEISSAGPDGQSGSEDDVTVKSN